MKFVYDRGILRIKATNPEGFGTMTGPGGAVFKAEEI
jgi:hypothetical protein